MSVRQFANSLDIIRRNEHRNRATALARHIYWQGRRLLFPKPLHLRLSQSTIMDDEPGGVISMVNMLGLYDYNNMHFVQMVLGAAPRQPPVFLDVGANIGAYTLVASEVPGTSVISLEPVPAAFAKLQRNIALNRRDRVHALNVGASRQPGVLRMTGNSSSVVNHVVSGNAGGEATIMVEVDTLDAISQRLGLSPAMIKIDVEGHEPEVLAGAIATLEACEACIVENGDRPVIVEFMHKHGLIGPLHYRHRDHALRRAPQPLPEDQIFVAREFAARFPAVTVEA